MKLTDTLLLFRIQANALVIFMLPYDAWKQNYFAILHLQMHISPKIQSERKYFKFVNLLLAQAILRQKPQKDQSTV